MSKKELVKDKVNLPAEINLEEFAGFGMEAVSVKDMAIPFLKILQDLSPEIKPNKPEYIEGAVQGKICNTVTGDLYDSVRVIPCYISSVINEWKPKRGGYVATHQENSPIVQTAVRTSEGLRTKSGNELVDTTNWYVLIENKDGSWGWGIIAFTMTALKKSRKFISKLQAIKLEGANGPFSPPMFSHIVQLSTALETKDNNEWYNWKIELDDEKSYDISTDLFTMAKDYYEQVKKGDIKAAPPSDQSTDTDIY